MKWSRNTVKKSVMKCVMKYAHKKSVDILSAG